VLKLKGFAVAALSSGITSVAGRGVTVDVDALAAPLRFSQQLSANHLVLDLR
jgi:hypothetical protein